MKTLLILALLAMAATMATAQFDPSEQYQPYPEQQQPFLQQQQPFLSQQPFLHPLQQQLNPCRQFLVQQCPVAVVPFRRSQNLQQSSCQLIRQQCCRQLAQIPEQVRCPAIHSIVQAIIMQQQQQQQQFFQPQQQGFFLPFAQQMIQSFFQPQQQQGYFQSQLQQGFFQPQLQQGLFNPQLQQGFFQPQLQQGLFNPQLQQGFFQPQQLAQIEGMRAFALQALPAMCDVYVPPHCSVAIAPLGSI